MKIINRIKTILDFKIVIIFVIISLSGFLLLKQENVVQEEKVEELQFKIIK